MWNVDWMHKISLDGYTNAGGTFYVHSWKALIKIIHISLFPISIWHVSYVSDQKKKKIGCRCYNVSQNIHS